MEDVCMYVCMVLLYTTRPLFWGVAGGPMRRDAFLVLL
jgi:hypothetical protein